MYLNPTKTYFYSQKNKSTVTAGLLLQSLIAEALDDDSYVALAIEIV